MCVARAQQWWVENQLVWAQRAKKRVVSIMKLHSVSPRLAEGVPADVINTGVL